MLRIAEGICGYAGRAVMDGLSPESARRAALEAAGDLEAAASALRRLARPDPVAPVADPARQDEAARRRAVALELAASGCSSRAIAERLGVTAGTARRYLRVASGQT